MRQEIAAAPLDTSQMLFKEKETIDKLFEARDTKVEYGSGGILITKENNLELPKSELTEQYEEIDRLIEDINTTKIPIRPKSKRDLVNDKLAIVGLIAGLGTWLLIIFPYLALALAIIGTLAGFRGISSYNPKRRLLALTGFLLAGGLLLLFGLSLLITG